MCSIFRRLQFVRLWLNYWKQIIKIKPHLGPGGPTPPLGPSGPLCENVKSSAFEMFLSTWGPSIPGNPDGPSGPGGPGGPLGPGINLGSTSLQWWECYAESQTIFVWLDIEAQKRFLTAACWWRGGRGVQPRDARRARWTWEIIAEAEEKHFSKQKFWPFIRSVQCPWLLTKRYLCDLNDATLADDDGYSKLMELWLLLGHWKLMYLLTS